MPRKAVYPDWVMAHKKKGTYINKVGDKYYLYAAHSERVEGKKYPVRVSDGYLGRITEQDGLIPAKSRIEGITETFEIGLSYAILSCTRNILKGLGTSYRKFGTAIYCCSVLACIFGVYSKELFEHSYLSILFSGTAFPEKFTKAQLSGIERGKRMLNDSLATFYGDDLPLVWKLFPEIRLMKINDKFYLSPLLSETIKLSEKYNIDWRNGSWQK